MWLGRRRGSETEGRGESAYPAGRLVFEADPELGEELQSAARARGEAPERLATDLLARGLEQEALRVRVENILTPRERQVVWLAARGWTNRRIAEALFVSPETVKTHVAHILEKLRLRSKVELRVLLQEPGGRNWQGDRLVGAMERQRR